MGPLIHIFAHRRTGPVEDWGLLHIEGPLIVGEPLNLPRHDHKRRRSVSIPMPIGDEVIFIKEVKRIVPTRRKGLLGLLREFDGPSIELHLDVQNWSYDAIDVGDGE
jgi:hypothetical protein